MIPKTSVSPAAIRKSMTPSWRPFRAWTSRIMGSDPLHLALLGVDVGVVREDEAPADQLEVAALLHHLAEVEVLDREVVGVVIEGPAHRLEVGLAEGGPQALLVLD